MFGEIVGQISCSKFQKNVVISLQNSILYPIKAHIHGFGVFLLYFVADNAIYGAVFRIHGCCWLWVAHFLQGGSNWFAIFLVVGQHPHFCLHRLLNHIFNYVE